MVSGLTFVSGCSAKTDAFLNGDSLQIFLKYTVAVMAAEIGTHAQADHNRPPQFLGLL